MDYDLLYPGAFLKSAEFGGKDVTLTISAVELQELEGDKGKKTRGVISFGADSKKLVLNRTNGECFKAMFGRETNDWIGRRVTLWAAPYVDNITGEKTTAIRVRGSPDLQKPMPVEIRLPKRKPVTITLVRTGGAPAQQSADPVARRKSAIWAKAQATGVTAATFAAWVFSVLGRNVPTAKWSDADMDQLEHSLIAPPHDAVTGEVMEPPPPSDSDAPGGVA